MTPAQQAKAAGLKSLSQVRDMLGTNKSGHPMVSLQTLSNWHKNKPDLFEAVLKGVGALAHVKWIKWADKRPSQAGVYLTFWSDGAIETYEVGADELDVEEVIVGKRIQSTLLSWAENVEPPK